MMPPLGPLERLVGARGDEVNGLLEELLEDPAVDEAENMGGVVEELYVRVYLLTDLLDGLREQENGCPEYDQLGGRGPDYVHGALNVDVQPRGRRTCPRSSAPLSRRAPKWCG